MSPIANKRPGDLTLFAQLCEMKLFNLSDRGYFIHMLYTVP